MTDLSVVLISKNQAWNISRLIESVIAETSEILSKEILLVDSASSDKTIEIARNYPIHIIRLRSNQRLTSHGGRFVGYKNTTGDLILFLDGDMELINGWLKKALVVFQTQPDVAVVTGPWLDLPVNTPTNQQNRAKQLETGIRNAEVRSSGGAAMYRRVVLQKVGSFNPYLYSDGEPELCVRIRYAGYRIIKLGNLISYHYSDPTEAMSTLIKRWKRNLWLGMGQGIRYHLGSELFWPYVKERGFGCLPFLVVGAGIISVGCSLAFHNWIFFSSWLLIISLIIILILIRKRSIYKTIYTLLQRTLALDGTIRGFLIKPMNPETFPDKYEIIQ